MVDDADGGEPQRGAAPTGPTQAGLRRSLIYFSTVAGGQALSFLLLPFVTRALEPEAYGAYALALAVSTLVGMLASSWVRNVGLRLYFDAATRGTTRGFFLGTALVRTAGFVVLYGGTLAGFALFGVELASWRVLISAGFAMLFGDLAVHATTLLRAEQRTAAFAVSEIGAGALRFVLTLAGLAAGIRSAELLFDAQSAGYLIAAAFAVPVLWRRMEGPFRVDWRGTLEVVRHGPASLPFSVADWIERLADRLVIEYFLGTAVVGVYSVGYSIGERTIGALVKAVFMMAWPSILSAWKEGGTASARAAIREAQGLYLWFATGPVVFMIVYGAEFMRWITGSAYHEAAPLVGIVSASMWLGGFATYLNRHLELAKRFGPLSAIRMAGALVNLGLNLVLVPRFGMIGAAWATLANRLLNALVFWAIRDRELVEIPFGALAAAAATSVAAWGATAWLPVPALAKMGVFIALYTPTALFAMRRGRT
jgi:O-antigen/teichoic acid export membrane protein